MFKSHAICTSWSIQSVANCCILLLSIRQLFYLCQTQKPFLRYFDFFRISCASDQVLNFHTYRDRHLSSSPQASLLHNCTFCTSSSKAKTFSTVIWTQQMTWNLINPVTLSCTILNQNVYAYKDRSTLPCWQAEKQGAEDSQ